MAIAFEDTVTIVAVILKNFLREKFLFHNNIDTVLIQNLYIWPYIPERKKRNSPKMCIPTLAVIYRKLITEGENFNKTCFSRANREFRPAALKALL